MNEQNKLKIVLTDNTFDVTLNPGESMDLHLKNQDGKVYLTSMPTKIANNNSISTQEVSINNGYKSVSYQSNNRFDQSNNISEEKTNKIQSSIYDLLNKSNQNVGKEKIEEDVENVKSSEAKYIESDSVNENDEVILQEPKAEVIQDDTYKTTAEEDEEVQQSDTEEADSNLEVLKRKYFPIDEDEE